jgi:hypothetical protein
MCPDIRFFLQLLYVSDSKRNEIKGGIPSDDEQ